MLRCVIVDDEPLARERLRVLLGEAIMPVQVIGEAANGKEAVPLIHAVAPEAVFLDVQMPVLDGFDVVDLLPPPRPHLIFVTAYDEYAIRAFEVHALDYLTKPVRLERLNRCLERLAGMQEMKRANEGLHALERERADQPLRRLSIHVGRRVRVLDLADVRRIEAREKLVFVHVEDGAYPTDFTLDILERRLNARDFTRIHRSHIVNLAFVREITNDASGKHYLVLFDNQRLPVARRRLREVLNAL